MSITQHALVADVGGTHVRFGLATGGTGETPRVKSSRQFAVADHPSLIAAARHYLAELPAGSSPGSAVLAIAGRIDGDLAEMTNHPWRIHAGECAAALGLERVALINDFGAQALAIPHLHADEQLRIGGAVGASYSGAAATYAVLGPGTGLGVSALLRRGGQEFVLESEGGHSAFAPKTSRQRDILAQLVERHPRVSYERLLSGNGLCNLHWALSRLEGEANPAPLQPEQVTAAALAGDKRSREALQLFCAVLGAFAGDLVLTFGAWEGVYLSGGLVPRLITELQEGAFRSAFENKGRFSSALGRVPVHAVTHLQAGLLGAAALALRGEPGSSHAATPIARPEQGVAAD